MSRKNIVLYQIAENQSMAANYTSEPTVINFLDNCSYQIDITTSDSTGTFEVQGSLNYKRSEPSDTVVNPGTWVTLTLGGGTPTAAGANDNILIDLNQLPFSAIRLKYNSVVAGTGTMNIYLVAKQLGG